MELTIVKQDNHGHDVAAVNAATLKAALKLKGIVGKPAQQAVRDQLRAMTGHAADFTAGFVRGWIRSRRWGAQKCTRHDD